MNSRAVAKRLNIVESTVRYRAKELGIDRTDFTEMDILEISNFRNMPKNNISSLPEIYFEYETFAVIESKINVCT